MQDSRFCFGFQLRYCDFPPKSCVVYKQNIFRHYVEKHYICREERIKHTQLRAYMNHKPSFNKFLCILAIPFVLVQCFRCSLVFSYSLCVYFGFFLPGIVFEYSNYCYQKAVYYCCIYKGRVRKWCGHDMSQVFTTWLNICDFIRKRVQV